MLTLLRELEQGTAIEQMLAGRVAYDPVTGAYLRRSMGRRRNGRPARYYLKLVCHELGEAVELTAYTDEEAVEKARTLYISPTRSKVAADDSPRRFDPVRGDIDRKEQPMRDYIEAAETHITHAEDCDPADPGTRALMHTGIAIASALISACEGLDWIGRQLEEPRRVQVLEAQAEALATALQAIYDGINDEWHPAFREDLLTDQDRTLLVRARAALTGWQEAEK